MERDNVILIGCAVFAAFLCLSFVGLYVHPAAVPEPTNNNLGIQSANMEVPTSYVPFASPQGKASATVPDAPKVVPSNCAIVKMYNDNVGVMACDTDAGVTHTTVHVVEDSRVL